MQNNPARWPVITVFAYEAFKRAPDKTLDVSTQAEKFSEFNAGKVMSDARVVVALGKVVPPSSEPCAQ